MVWNSSACFEWKNSIILLHAVAYSGSSGDGMSTGRRTLTCGATMSDQHSDDIPCYILGRQSVCTHHICDQFAVLDVLVAQRLCPENLGDVFARLDREVVAVPCDPIFSAEYIPPEVYGRGNGKVGGKVDSSAPLSQGRHQHVQNASYTQPLALTSNSLIHSGVPVGTASGR